MTVFVVTEIEPEHARARTVVGIFGTSQKAKAFIEKQKAELESGQYAGVATEKTMEDIWWKIDEFNVE
jgi:hypothetical protein